MACLASPFDFDAIKAESDANDFRGVNEDGDDGIDFDQVMAVESQIRNALMEFQIDEATIATASALTPDEAEEYLKKAKKKAAKAKKLLKKVEAGLNEEEDEFAKEQENWMMTTAQPETGISLTDALVGKSLFERNDEDEEGEENLEHGRIELPKEEKKSIWEACCAPAQEKVKGEEAPKAEVEEGEAFDWAKERRKSKSKGGKKKSLRRINTMDDAPAPSIEDEGKEESKKKKKKGVRRSKSSD